MAMIKNQVISIPGDGLSLILESDGISVGTYLEYADLAATTKTLQPLYLINKITFAKNVTKHKWHLQTNFHLMNII